MNRRERRQFARELAREHWIQSGANLELAREACQSDARLKFIDASTVLVILQICYLLFQLWQKWQQVEPPIVESEEELCAMIAEGQADADE